MNICVLIMRYLEGGTQYKHKAFRFHRYLLPRACRLFYTVFSVCLHSDCDQPDVKISLLGVILVPPELQILEHFRYQRFGLVIMQTIKSAVLFLLSKVFGSRGEENMICANL